MADVSYAIEIMPTEDKLRNSIMPREGTDGWRAAAIGLFIALSNSTLDIPTGPVPMAKVIRDVNMRKFRRHSHPHAIHMGPEKQSWVVNDCLLCHSNN